jgi:ubiquinone/menaquinone biosynthesis C-methylase UbiE
MVMAASDEMFAGSIPEVYARLMVPMLFEPYALDVAERVGRIAPLSVLETAAGTGVLTRAIAARLPAGARIVATDLNQPMLDLAAARQPGDDRMTWRQADAQSLPMQDRCFDAVVCQFGAMFFPDKPRAFREARRVLKPDGHFIFTVWDRISTNAFAETVMQALAAVFPDDPPRFLARIPHGYFDTDSIRQDLTAAGFATVSAEAVDLRSRAMSARDAAAAFCQGTPLRSEIDARDAARLSEATDRAEEALASRFGGGAIEGRMRAFVITAAC